MYSLVLVRTSRPSIICLIDCIALELLTAGITNGICHALGNARNWRMCKSDASKLTSAYARFAHRTGSSGL
jgi:hypothetical protein